MKWLVITLLSLLSSFAMAMAKGPLSPVKTVENVDLDRYIGKWHEVASIPQWFQKDCVANTTAEYMKDGDLIIVLNSCEMENGERKLAEGRAKVVDTKTNAKLKVTFVKFFHWIFAFGGKYWILDLAEDYSYAVVGDPSREYAWILSRTPLIPYENLVAAELTLKAQGYDTCKVLTSLQDEGFTRKTPLCKAVENRY